ncbi:MAG: DMT family transporter [Bacteroidales bacterium]|jgi:drug/metabolite transporter (DMT)-like permease|nr:DMT family transporter [Bacteroidales bacterium]
MNEIIKAHIALSISGLIFGLNYWIAKGLMPEPLDPRQIVFIRVFIAAILFWIIAWFIKREPVKIRDLGLIVLSSMLGVSINQLFFFEGLNLTTPVDAAIIHTTSPILVLLFATWIIKEKITWTNVLGIIIGASGAVLLILSGLNGDFPEGNIRGNLFILVNNTAYALYLVLIKPVMQKYHPITVMKWLFVFGLVSTAPFTLHSMKGLDYHVFSGYVLFAMIFVVLGTTMLAYLLTIYGLKFLKASVTGYYIYLQPIIAAIIGLIWFGEIFTLGKGLAAICIFAGVYLVNLKSTTIKVN